MDSHRFRRQTHVTPKSYLSFLNSYKQVYAERHAHISALAERMNTGLQKLNEASETVQELSKELAVKEKELAVANEKAELVLKDVTVKATAAERVKSQVQKVKDKAQAIVDAIARDKALAESKLELARPALEEAEQALNTIKPADIVTVRKLTKPPHLIMRIMDCGLILFQRHLDVVTVDPERPCCKPSWSDALKFMAASALYVLYCTIPGPAQPLAAFHIFHMLITSRSQPARHARELPQGLDQRRGSLSTIDHKSLFAIGSTILRAYS